MQPEIKVFQNLDELSCSVAALFVSLAKEAIRSRNRFTVALAGGSTPKRLYQLLADENEPFRTQIDWQKTYFFWGDERCVLPTDDESNFKMANEALLAPLEISPENIFRFNTEYAPQIAAEDYENTLEEVFGLKRDGLPRFDLILLGMGADAHTASLFPNTKVIDEKTKLAAAFFVEKFDRFRLTLTPPVLNNAANVVFLVTGKEKAEALQQVFYGAFEPQRFPAQVVQPENGKLFWFIDEAAASRI